MSDTTNYERILSLCARPVPHKEEVASIREYIEATEGRPATEDEVNDLLAVADNFEVVVLNDRDKTDTEYPVLRRQIASDPHKVLRAYVIHAHAEERRGCSLLEEHGGASFLFSAFRMVGWMNMGFLTPIARRELARLRERLDDFEKLLDEVDRELDEAQAEAEAEEANDTAPGSQDA
ncbi:MAG: hypothetical protein AAFX41_17985 [Bacteroidota bacterium]